MRVAWGVAELRKSLQITSKIIASFHLTTRPLRGSAVSGCMEFSSDEDGDEEGNKELVLLWWETTKM